MIRIANKGFGSSMLRTTQDKLRKTAVFKA
jgi:hypothetical protein